MVLCMWEPTLDHAHLALYDSELIANHQFNSIWLKENPYPPMECLSLVLVKMIISKLYILL